MDCSFLVQKFGYKYSFTGLVTLKCPKPYILFFLEAFCSNLMYFLRYLVAQLLYVYNVCNCIYVCPSCRRYSRKKYLNFLFIAFEYLFSILYKYVSCLVVCIAEVSSPLDFDFSFLSFSYFMHFRAILKSFAIFDWNCHVNFPYSNFL